MPKSLKEKKEDELILTTFKWNVHTQARTTPQKYLTEIVHDNPVWINTQTAKKYKIKNGDIIKITTFIIIPSLILVKIKELYFNYHMFLIHTL